MTTPSTFLPGKSHGQRSLAGCTTWVADSDTTMRQSTHTVTEETRKGTSGTHHSHQLKLPIWMFLFIKAPPLLLTSRRVLSPPPAQNLSWSSPQPHQQLSPLPRVSTTSLKCKVTSSLSTPPHQNISSSSICKLNPPSLEVRVGTILGFSTMHFEILSFSSSQQNLLNYLF